MFHMLQRLLVLLIAITFAVLTARGQMMSGGKPQLLTVVSYKAAVAQSGSASLGMSCRTGACPIAAASEGTNTTIGVAQFAQGNSVEDHFYLPTDVTGSVNVVIRWRAAATTGSVVWQVRTAGLAPGATSDPVWGVASSISAAPSGTAGVVIETTLSSVGLPASVAPGQEFFWQLARGTDTLSGVAEVLSVAINYRRSL